MESPNPAFMCRFPFNFVSKDGRGYALPCCRYSPSSEELQDPDLRGSVEKAFNSTTFKNIRKKMQRGETLTGCQKCYDEEKSENTSYGRRFTKSTKHFPPNVLKGIHTAFSRQCNLACRMCHSDYSTKWNGIERKLYPDKKTYPSPEIKLEEIISEEETYKNVDIWDIVGGEPFINDSFYRFLKKIKPWNLSEKTMELSTNCTFFPKPKYIDILLQFKTLDISLSIDGVGELGEYIRIYSKWPKVNKTVEAWAELALKNPSIDMRVLTTISAYNVHGLYRIFKWAKDKKLPLKLNTLYWPHCLQIWILPENIRRKIFDYYSQFPDFKKYLKQLKFFLLRKQEGNREEFLSFTDKLDKICKQDFFSVNSFWTRDEFLEGLQ